ncbi:hypothetical protein [Paenibacillus sp. IHBB 3054]|uniref:hypothetical protein n=1 Tax=Paenibacillus sp. IHBB 3054 TaxID=3425689 RepID=UPI003F66D60C
MDQSLLDGLGIGIAFVSLASLLKHGLYKAADKIANRKNIAALDDALKALTNEADTAAKLKTNLPHEMVVKDGGLMDELARSKSLAGADDARTVGKPKAEGSSRSVEGTGDVDDFAKEPFLPDEYYKNNYAPMQGTPGARIDFSRLGSSGQIEKSRVIYDQAGKQKYRIDFSDHGNSAHHTNPHMHEYVYQDAGKSVKSEIKYFMDFSIGRLRKGIIDEATNSIKFID